MADQEHKKLENITLESMHVMVAPSDIARESFLYAKETGHLYYSAYPVASNYVDGYLIVYIVNGQGNLIYQKKEYSLQRDNILFIDCRKPFQLNAIKNTTWTILYLHFNGSQAHSYYNIATSGKRHVFKVINNISITSRFWQIIDLTRKKDKDAELLTNLHITRIFTEICMLRDDTVVPEVEYPLFITRIFHHLNQYHDEKISLDMLSELYSVSKYYLVREFKRYSGVTLSEYLTTIRVNKAKALLHNTEKNVNEIAAMLGFYNAGHFIKQFRVREHMTPIVYRNQWRR